MTEDQRALSRSKKRRGVVRASVTRLYTRIAELEGSPGPETLEHARRLSTRLETLDAEYKAHHLDVVDLLDDEDELAAEQDVLDEHDDRVSQLAVRLEKLIATCASTDSSKLKTVSRRLSHIDKGVSFVREALPSAPLDDDKICLLHQYTERMSELKKELQDVRRELMSQDPDKVGELGELQAHIDQHIFDCSLEIKKLLRTHTPSPVVGTPDLKGVKLPKLEVPTFDGNILNWKTFWEQFSVAVHERSSLADAEKLAYLRHAVKSGTAKSVIEGLSRSGEHYLEAVSSLQSRYDRPRLIHQAHVRKIVEAPGLKEGNGKELRRLHDAVQQHLRALKALGHEPSGSFITSLIELKLDTSTMFEWQRHSQESSDVPHYQQLLDFINLRAQASESSTSDAGRKSFKHDVGSSSKKSWQHTKPVTAYAASTDTSSNCVLCKSEKHPLYVCPKFKSFSHDAKMSAVKGNGLCVNCMRSGHFVRSCKSLHRCRVCQKPHHTLLHIEEQTRVPSPPPTDPGTEPPARPTPVVGTHAATGIKTDLLLMTCRVRVKSSDGSDMEARALLDPGSSASFISERVAQALHLPRTKQSTRISGVAGLMRNSTQHVTSFCLTSVHAYPERFSTTAVIVPQVTCELPLHPISFDQRWSHLHGLRLADSGFGQPGRIDLLLGVEVFAEVVLNGRRCGSPGTPIALETRLGWVLAGSTHTRAPVHEIVVNHATLLSGDDLLRCFWEVEEKVSSEDCNTPDERAVLKHFKSYHTRSEDGRFMVPLPKKPGMKPLGESRSQAVRRFLSFERALHAKGQFAEFKKVIDEYFDVGHAEPVPVADLQKSPQSVFYLPMHAVSKGSSTTTKIRAVFDASAKSSTGVSLNDTLLVGPTVHSPLVDVLLRFRRHRIALVADVSRMYRAVALTKPDRDLHRFVWRSSLNSPIQDYRMTRVTFGVSASSFLANMCVKQNALDFAVAYPLAAKAVQESFYVDDGLTGADTVEEALKLHQQLQELFHRGGFLLRKWSSSEVKVLQHIHPELREQKSVHTISAQEEYSKTLGVEWNSGLDHFRLTVSELPVVTQLTKRALTSDIARIFDVLGWFAPAVVKVKILLQRLWEEKVHWDDPVPPDLEQTWRQWRSELGLLMEKQIPRCHHPRDVNIAYQQLHGFSDASEQAYAGVVYLRMVDTSGFIHTSLVMAKTKVAPIKRITIPRLELSGALLLARLLQHCQTVLGFSSEDVFAWTDSTIVLNWIVGNPRRFRTYVANRVASIIDLVPPSRWNHVEGSDNPADCASRGLFPAELLAHRLWWKGPSWLQLGIHYWLKSTTLPPNNPSEEADEMASHVTIVSLCSFISLDRYSSFSRLKRVTAWALRFISNCRSKLSGATPSQGPLSVAELNTAEILWLSNAQQQVFQDDIESLKTTGKVPKSSSLRVLHCFVDPSGLLRVGGRVQKSKFEYSQRHPIVLHGRHPLTKLIVRAEHIRLLHAGPTVVNASLSRRYHIIRQRSIVRTVTRGCVTCRRHSARPLPPLMGQLPPERITPGIVFENVGIDYAGPILLKLGRVRKPTVVKAYICVFVAMSVKAIHLEPVSDLTSAAFVACLRRFIARRGKPTTIWSDHGSNFIGASRELTELTEFLERQKLESDIPDFCTSQGIRWSFIPEHAPHFGGLWESAVKSMKVHLKRVVGNAKLTFEELSTVLAQVEACLNSRPLGSLPNEEDGIEVLTPGHFLIGRPLEGLPDPPSSHQAITVVRRWNLCQALTRHFWKRWSTDYFASLRKFAKWHDSTRNISVGDVVMLREDSLVPARWPLAKVVNVHPGEDGIVRVATVRTAGGHYKRPITKLAVLLPMDQ